MKLAYVCLDRGIPVLGHKGASEHVRAITTALQACGHEVVVVCAALGEGNPVPAVDEIVEVGTGADDVAIERLLRANRVEAVVERYALESGPARRASARLGLPQVLEVNAPLVWEAHRHRGLADPSPGLERERSIFAGADAIAVVSRALDRYVRGVAPEAQVEWVPNGVDCQAFAGAAPARLPVPVGSPVVGFVGSMKAWHGVDDLVTAFGLLAPVTPGAHLVLAGSGPEELAVGERVRSDPVLADRVHLLGAVSHDRVPSLLAAVDVGAVPYRPSDDFYFCPLKALEYLAAGVPTVHPGLGDLPELVGDAGVAYEPGDVQALASALARLLGNAELRADLAARAGRRARLWTWDRAAKALETMVQAALSTPAGAP